MTRYALICIAALCVACGQTTSNPNGSAGYGGSTLDSDAATDASSDVDPDTGVTYRCGLVPRACLDATARTVPDTNLAYPNNGFIEQLMPEEYVDPARTGCENQYVLDISPEHLSGSVLTIDIKWWDYVIPITDAGLLCNHDYGTVHVYTKSSADADWVLVDHRTMDGVADEVGALCEARALSGGPGEPDYADWQRWNAIAYLTPTLYPNGVRIVAAMLRDCEPLPLRADITEAF